MNSFAAAIRRFADDDDGITAIEYGLIAALIVVAITTTLTGVSSALVGKFNEIIASLGGTPA